MSRFRSAHARAFARRSSTAGPPSSVSRTRSANAAVSKNGVSNPVSPPVMNSRTGAVSLAITAHPQESASRSDQDRTNG